MSQLVHNGITASILDLLSSSEAESAIASLMITGGRGAESLYKKWNEAGIFEDSPRPVDIFLTDERCVPSDHLDSNYHLVQRTLFAVQPADGVVLHRMKGDATDVCAEANRYGRVLPDSIDLMLLSVGEDGHVASLFPHDQALKEVKRKVVPVCGGRAPYQRLTITPQVIRNAKQVFVLALGKEKRAMYEEALRKPEDIDSIPARLVLDRKWIFDLDDETNSLQMY